MNYYYKITLPALFIFALAFQVNAQNHDMDTPQLKDHILELDSSFWLAYNTCDMESFQTFLTEDLEFYHDKGGLTKTSALLLTMVSEGLCGNKNSVLRREAIEGTVEVFPMNNYGAIISGEHLFYMTENGQEERLTGSAKFTHLWRHENNEWRMARVLSYDHQDTSENKDKASINLDLNILKSFVGTYNAPDTGVITISLTSENELKLDASKLNAILHPENEHTFFVYENPVTFEFVKNAEGIVTKFIVWENGNNVEEAIKE